jgi:hypothetical protein
MSIAPSNFAHLVGWLAVVSLRNSGGTIRAPQTEPVGRDET